MKLELAFLVVVYIAVAFQMWYTGTDWGMAVDVFVKAHPFSIPRNENETFADWQKRSIVECEQLGTYGKMIKPGYDAVVYCSDMINYVIEEARNVFETCFEAMVAPVISAFLIALYSFMHAMSELRCMLIGLNK